MAGIKCHNKACARHKVAHKDNIKVSELSYVRSRDVMFCGSFEKCIFRLHLGCLQLINFPFHTSFMGNV